MEILNYKECSKKWGKVSKLNFKQMLTIVELLGSQATHPTEVTAFVDAMYCLPYDPKEKEAVIQLGIEAWERVNLWEGANEWVRDSNLDNVVYIGDYIKN